MKTSLFGGISLYIKATLITIAAWFIGLVLDANIDLGDPQGFACLRILFPILAMGLCLLKAIGANQKKQDK